MEFRTGWIPDVPDIRDYAYAATALKSPISWWRRLIGTIFGAARKYPKSVDLRTARVWPAIFNQGNLGSCVENAWVAAMAFVATTIFSRLFLYYEVRKGVPTDTGSSIREGIKTMAKVGDCREVVWPYDLRVWTQKPPLAAYTEAITHSKVVYARLSTLDDMLHCLASGFPFVFGMSVYGPFRTLNTTHSHLPMPKATDEFLGGHALCAVGYSTIKKCFLVRNSWGEDWGDRGFFWLPFEYATDLDLADDFWTVRSVAA